MRTTLVLLILAACIAQTPARASTTYRYVAAYDGGLCLIGADGVARLRLAATGEHSDWSAPTVSPDGSIVALLTTDPKDGEQAPPAQLFQIDPVTGKRRLVFTGQGFEMPDFPVWLGKTDILLERRDKDDLVEGVYDVNIRTGVSRRVVPPQSDNGFSYANFIPSPSRKFLATTLAVTASVSISVNDVSRGTRLWGVDPMLGFSNVCWSPDSRWLLVAFYIDNEFGSDSPGGLWKFDAKTGKRHPWKYARQSIDGLWPSPDHRIIAYTRRRRVEFMHVPDGKTLQSVSAAGLGKILGVGFRRNGGSVICGDRRLAVIDSRGKIVKSFDVRGISGDTWDARYSPARDAVMYGASGVVDLKTGKLLKFKQGTESEFVHFDWLSRDIVR